MTWSVCGINATSITSPSEGRHREAHPVEGDRPLLHHVAQQARGQPDGQADAVRAVGPDGRHLGDPVDVPLHEMASEAGGEGGRPLDVHGVARARAHRGSSGRRSPAERSKESSSPSRPTTVRHTPPIAIESPIAASDGRDRAPHDDARPLSTTRPRAELLNDPGEHPPPPSDLDPSRSTDTMSTGDAFASVGAPSPGQPPGRVRAADHHRRQVQDDLIHDTVADRAPRERRPSLHQHTLDVPLPEHLHQAPGATHRRLVAIHAPPRRRRRRPIPDAATGVRARSSPRASARPHRTPAGRRGRVRTDPRSPAAAAAPTRTRGRGP